VGLLIIVSFSKQLFTTTSSFLQHIFVAKSEVRLSKVHKKGFINFKFSKDSLKETKGVLSSLSNQFCCQVMLDAFSLWSI
jgi:hypothetical protein